MCSETFIRSNFEGALNLKVELETLNYKLLQKLKILFLMRLVHLDCFLKSSANRSSDQQILFLQKELTNKDNMIQCLLNQLSKQTNFIQKQN